MIKFFTVTVQHKRYDLESIERYSTFEQAVAAAAWWTEQGMLAWVTDNDEDAWRERMEEEDDGREERKNKA